MNREIDRIREMLLLQSKDELATKASKYIHKSSVLQAILGEILEDNDIELNAVQQEFLKNLDININEED